MTRLETTASHPEPLTTRAWWVLCVAVVALAAACGGGTPAYTVVVKTVDTQGQPIAGVTVSVTDNFGGMSVTTRSDGTATLIVDSTRVPGPSTTLYATLTGYHSIWRELQLAPASGPIVQQLTLMRTDEAQLVLGGLTSQVSADASSVVVSADIDVVGLNGSSIAGLSAADFTVRSLDCGGYDVCILEPSGAPSDTGYWVPSQSDPVQVTLSGAAPSTLYRVRYVLEATPGMFTAGRTVLSYADVRVGADTWLGIQIDGRL